jgi:hypothetical protein
MPEPSLFPKFMNPLGGGTGVGGGEIVVELMAEPDITLESDVSIEVVTEAIDIELEPDVDIELEVG